ncbi:hypothetical protein EV127DRAFT_367996 [Xylaria flabelliformis]|nr:hypothetical protein EV127DRAFT_367996 [Xylaria flabelliformis]
MSNPEDYTIGWICAVETEYVAAQEFLDEEHPQLAYQEVNDHNIYCLGRMGQHKIAIACLPYWSYGLVNAANVAKDMLRTFTNLRFGLMVGIGGGVPTYHDIRLGDVVVSSVDYEKGAVFQYDFGQTIQDKAFKTTGHQDKPPKLLLSAVQNLQVKYKRSGNKIDNTVASVLDGNRRLLDDGYVHISGSPANCASTCGLDDANIITRQPRTECEDDPKVHYGLIASGNQLMNDAELRDRLAEETGVLCFEMEAAGLMDQFKCLVVRGISDYADSHKNEGWQGYAAMTAAAYAKDLLNVIPPSKILAEEKLSKIINDVSVVAGDTQHRVQDLQADAHLNTIRNWLSPSDPSTNFNDALELCHPGSGQWLLRHTAYSTWKSKNNSFLWLCGIPGCGKTVLTSTILHDLKQDEARSTGLLYFYFTFNDTSKQHLEDAIKSLVSQLYSNSNKARECLDSLYKSCEKGERQPSLDDLCTTFQNMVQKAGEVCIILDALDECETRNVQQSKDLLSWIESLRNTELTIHLLVTSRPEQDIKSAIESCTCGQDIINIQSDLIEEDIRSYIQTRVRKHPLLGRWQTRPDVQGEIETALMEKASGMFRWVYCQLDVLKDCLDLPSVRRALASLPETLDETYARILTNVPSKDIHYTTRLLQFLIYSKRPLRIDEAVDAIAIDLEKDPPFDEGNRMPIPQEITRYCSSLVTTATRKIKDNGETIMEIQLAHYSVQEYLISDRLRDDLAIQLEEIPARKSISKLCVTYLLQIKHGLSSEEVRKSYPMAEYSARYWASHAVAAGIDDDELIIKLFTCHESFKICYQLHSPDSQIPFRARLPPSALYYASLKGLSHAVRTLIDLGADVNAESGMHRYALRAAAGRGHETIVQMLLDEGANVNSLAESLGTALEAAVQMKHERIVQMLLEKGADANNCETYYFTLLSKTASDGHENIIRMLLETAADVETHNGFALACAASRGYDVVLKMLLAKGADVNGYDGTPLRQSALHGHEQIVQILLEQGADPNLRSDEDLHALRSAVSKGHENIVQMLLEKGADVNADDALYDKVLNGHERIVRMLLGKGADPNLRSEGRERYKTILEAATERANENIVQMLLEKGADVNAWHDSTLLLATFNEQEKIVQMLLKWGAWDRKAIPAATCRDNGRILRLLIEKGVELVGKNEVELCLSDLGKRIRSEDEVDSVGASKRQRR